MDMDAEGREVVCASISSVYSASPLLPLHLASLVPEMESSVSILPFPKGLLRLLPQNVIFVAQDFLLGV